MIASGRVRVVGQRARPPAGFLSRPTRPALPVLRRFDDGPADALDERLGKADDNIGPQALALRASGAGARVRRGDAALTTVPAR
jgi:hypothetical protein